MRSGRRANAQTDRLKDIKRSAPAKIKRRKKNYENKRNRKLNRRRRRVINGRLKRQRGFKLSLNRKRKLDSRGSMAFFGVVGVVGHMVLMSEKQVPDSSLTNKM